MMQSNNLKLVNLFQKDLMLEEPKAQNAAAIIELTVRELITCSTEHLATKSDILATKSEIQATKIDIQKLDEKIQLLKDDAETELNNQKLYMVKEFSLFRSEVDQKFSDAKDKTAEGFNNMRKHINVAVSIIVGVIGALVALLRLVLIKY